jgi:hypothetical protein
MYCIMHRSSCDLTCGARYISAEYLDANESVLEERLKGAGVHLVQLLDTAFLSPRIENRSDVSRPALPVGLS